MNVYIVRHGESLGNLLKVRSGQTDHPLTEKGYAQAAAAGSRMQGIVFDRIFASDLQRAMETAKTALAGCSPEPVQDIREFDVGSASGKSTEQCIALYGGAFAENLARLDFSPYGGETAEQVRQRVCGFMKMLEGLQGCENIAVFSHFGPIVYMIEYVLGYTNVRKKMPIANAAVTVLRYEDGEWKVRQFNA